MIRIIRNISLIAVGLIWPYAFASEGYFGAQLADHESNGAEIVALLPDSPAANAGFRAGDQIIQAGGTAVGNAQALAAELRSFGAGRTIEVRYVREDVERQTQLTLGRNPWQNADQPDDDDETITTEPATTTTVVAEPVDDDLESADASVSTTTPSVTTLPSVEAEENVVGIAPSRDSICN